MASDPQSSSSSTQAFVSSLILYGIIGTVLYIVFSILRPKQPRVYQPKSLEMATVPEYQRPPEVPKAPGAWIADLWARPQQFFIQYIGLDGYLYVRYIGIFASISVVGGLILLPILLPVNATNGLDLSGFNILSFANVTQKNRFFAHVFLSWIFFGLVVWVIYKELTYYVTLRHSIQTTPYYDGLLSSRTVLITDIPEEFQTESELKRIFPLITRVWYARDYKELTKLTKERAKLGAKYEGALNGVVKKSVKYHAKLVKKGKEIPSEPKDLIRKEPTHRLGKIPFVGKKVNTIDYAIEKIPELNTSITALQETPEIAKQVGSVFLEFPNQLEAQRAFQSIPYHKDFKGERAIGVSPDDIIWSNLSLGGPARHTKKILANTFLSLLIIFWAIPVAVVGAISNITYLTEKVHFLRFINNCPKVLLGLITGILPVVALAVLMSFVPVIIKAVGKISGLKTRQEVELYCQSWYFGFQVVQIFLVVTLASSATSTVTAIIDDPSSAMTLLSNNLPKASNFYISYFLLQGLYAPAWTIVQAVGLALYHALSFLLNTPRKKWTKMNVLSKPSLGVIYPVTELLVVLFTVYAIIAPIILVFSSLALIMGYFVNLYVFTYVNGNQFDTRGRNYPKALFQTFVGLYLAEVCVLGLFITAKSWGPVALEAIILGVTVLAHLYFRYKFEGLFDIVPISGIHEARNDGLGTYPKDQGFAEIKQTGKNFASDNVASNDDAATYQSKPSSNPFKDNAANADSVSSKNETVDNQTNQATPKEVEQEKINKENDIEQIGKAAKEHPLAVAKKLLSPREGYNFSLLRSQLPPIYNITPNYSAEYLERAYTDPVIRDEEPKVWIPRDANGVSQYEIEKANGDVVVSDEGATIDEKAKLDVTGNPPGWEFEVEY